MKIQDWVRTRLLCKWYSGLEIDALRARLLIASNPGLVDHIRYLIAQLEQQSVPAEKNPARSEATKEVSHD